MPGGNLGPSVVVEAGSPLTRIGPVDESTGRIEVEAGAVAGEVDALLRKAGWFLPFLPSSAPWCSIGGIVANNAAGARSFSYGAVSKWVESLEGFLASGEAFRFGPDSGRSSTFDDLRDRLLPSTSELGADWPQVTKNSSGYALDRFLPSGDPIQLLVGSEGTLGVVTRVGLRSAPLPPHRGLVLLPARSPSELTALAAEAHALETITCEFLGRRLIEMAGLDRDREVGDLAREAFALVLLEVAGTEDEVVRDLDALQRIGDGVAGRGLATRDSAGIDRLWKLRHGASPTIAREADRGRISTQFIEDSVVPPERLGTYLEEVAEILREAAFDAVVFGHAGDGNVHVNPLVDVHSGTWRHRVRRTLDQVTTLVASLNGTLAGEHGDGRLRAPLLPRIWSDPAVRAFRTVKETLDPRGILNPGVVLPEEGQDPLALLSPRRRGHPAGPDD